MLAGDIVLHLFGEKWLPMVPVFYILSLFSLFTIIISIADPVFKSINKPHIMRNSQLISLPFFVLLIYPVATRFGYLGVSWVMVFLSIVRIAYLTPKLAEEISDFYRYTSVILFRIVLCTLIMMGGVFLLRSTIPMNILGLVICIIAGFAIYFLSSSFCDKELMQDIRDALIMVKKKLGFTTC